MNINAKYIFAFVIWIFTAVVISIAISGALSALIKTFAFSILFIDYFTQTGNYTMSIGLTNHSYTDLNLVFLIFVFLTPFTIFHTKSRIFDKIRGVDN